MVVINLEDNGSQLPTEADCFDMYCDKRQLIFQRFSVTYGADRINFHFLFLDIFRVACNSAVYPDLLVRGTMWWPRTYEPILGYRVLYNRSGITSLQYRKSPYEPNRIRIVLHDSRMSESILIDSPWSGREEKWLDFRMVA
jgi:hypothetical protein